jgi:hypothetical protein
MPILGSSDRAQLTYIPEVTFGVTPATTAANLRMTGESLSFNLTKVTDKEIRSDAQQVSTTTVNAQAAGDIKMHMQYGEYDRLLAAVMRTTWVVFGVNGVGATFTADFTATTITASAPTAGASIFTALQKGQWFRLTAPTTVNDGLWLRVSASVAPTSTVITLDASTPCSIATATALCTVASSRISNGTTLTSFTIEKQYADVTQFFALTGMYPSKFATTFTSAQDTEGTFSFLGKKSVRSGATTFTGAPTASLAFDIQNAVTGVGNLWEAGIPLVSTYIKSMSMDLDSALRAQDAIGNLGLVGVGIGTFMAKGNLDVYFSDGSLYDKFLTDTYTSITISTKDAAGNGYVFCFPRVMLTNAKVEAGGKNTDLTASFQWEAYADINNAVAGLRKTVLIDRLGVAVLP